METSALAHPFLERHREVVFILRTHVDHKTNSVACKRGGLEFGRSVFVLMDQTGVPVIRNRNWSDVAKVAR